VTKEARAILLPVAPRGVKGAALAACEENVDFLAPACMLEGVKAGESTLKPPAATFLGPGLL